MILEKLFALIHWILDIIPHISDFGISGKQSNELSKGRDGYLDPGQGAIAFPSLEGALLSLAFLTFAVFVIDLIQVSRS
jgi:hypothetical protein